MMHSGEILLSVHPWVTGTRACGWYDVVELHHAVSGKCWEDAIDGILNAAADRARDIGGNAVVGVEIFVDPFHEGGATIHLKGTIAKLESLFAGIEVCL